MPVGSLSEEGFCVEAAERASLERWVVVVSGSRPDLTLALADESREWRSGVGVSRRPREEDVEARGAGGESSEVGRACETEVARTWEPLDLRRSGKREARVERRAAGF